MTLLGQKDGRDVYLLPELQVQDDDLNFNCATNFDGTLVFNLGGTIKVPVEVIDNIKDSLNLD